MYRIEKYDSLYHKMWNDFVESSKNGTFLFHRDFMEYHKDRFEDYSLMIFDEQKLVAIFPANREGDTVYSHKGLTYGGLVYGNKIKLSGVIKIYNSLLKYFYDNNIVTFHLKPVPSIYHKLPSQEQEYVMFLINAKLSRRDGLSVIDRDVMLPITKSRKEAIKRGKKKDLVIIEEPNFKLFWEEILIPNLKKKHDSEPVHTALEMEYLYKKFPEQIRHFNVYHNNKIVAGTTMFITDTVAHPQYISGQEDKNTLGSLDYLYDYLINLFSDKKYFDFGPSTEEQGRKLNEGILFWKESFGARTMIQDFYEVNTTNPHLLDDTLQ
ncbi:MAG: GNAT family N-acetyltransferase [Flavobacterium sp. MedPE-SWcel]|uniref:GNAT family N-acetyltransferase n=1 Tax=uncultured Flavobacterium sp. TaxID=165435 RepID=UPI00091821BE|nr:GNAT family N-acetyltransferase [uncultured Flavobacterium sp.]OIQ17302.1 MAG: GNAT family N-acetyltransferase [Flavobacterium sp. MedPE-SWcel]